MPATKTVKKQTLHKVTATYSPVMPTLSKAKELQAKIRQNPKAQISPIKKTAKGYGFSFKLVFVTPKATIRDQAVAKLKQSKYARVSIGRV
jgi:hypothetical protein